MIAGSCMLQSRTHVAVWIPIALAAAAGVAGAAVAARRARVLGVVIAAVATAITMHFALLTVNYAIAQPESATTVTATVAGKHVRTDYGTRRVGRGRYVRDTSKKIYRYSYTLRLPDGSTLTRNTDAAHYIKLRTGMTESVELRRGILGWTTAR